jgi:hypothetical protein
MICRSKWVRSHEIQGFLLKQNFVEEVMTSRLVKQHETAQVVAPRWRLRPFIWQLVMPHTPMFYPTSL